MLFTGCTQPDEESVENPLVIHEAGGKHSDECHAIILQLSKKRACNSFEEEKEKTKQKFLKYFDDLKSPSKLELIKKAMAPISPILAAVSIAGANTRTFPTSSEPCFSRSNITAQRRLFSTKKTSKKEKHSAQLKCPDVQEMQMIALNLLNGKE